MPLLCFDHQSRPTLGVVTDSGVRPLELSLAALLALPLNRARAIIEGAGAAPVEVRPGDVLPPVDTQEIWAAGVTYKRSRDGRIEESGNESLYDYVYSSARPEIFLKATPQRVVTDGQPVGIRADSTWDVPEAEVALMINSRGEIFGYLVGNDMSSRSIEGENALYLPQAKVYEASCALSSRIIPVWESVPLPWSISVRVVRDGDQVFAGQTSTDAMKRTFEELVSWLMLALPFPDGVVLLTGTGLVPDQDVTVKAGDVITITIEGLGELTNPVVVVGSRFGG
jgi:2-dehydro-3-deoxy-D-arabinonate dehydratase